jgi:hypothetical protein
MQVTSEGLELDPTAVADRRTEAEKKREEHMIKYEESRARKAASKSHRDRIKVGHWAGAAGQGSAGWEAF